MDGPLDNLFIKLHIHILNEDFVLSSLILLIFFSGSHRVSESDAEMDSSLGILSPSDMKTSGIMSMTASQASNQGTHLLPSIISSVMEF